MKKEWAFTKLKRHTTKIGSGITPRGGESTYKATGIPFIRSQNVLTNRLDFSDIAFIDEKQHEKMSASKVYPGDVLLNITGASIGRSCVVPPEITEANVNQHVCVIRLKENIDANLLSTYLNSWFGQKQIWSFQSGGSREGLNYQQIGSFDVPHPPLSEQKAIADLLSTWDEAIEKIERLIRAKEKRFQWLLDDLIAKPCREVKWKEVRLGKLFESMTEKNTVDETNVLTTSAEHGLVSQFKYYKKSVSAEDVSGYYLLKKGDFAYNRSSSNGYPYGVIKRLDESDQGVLSTLYICMRPISGQEINSDFYVHLFESGILNRKLRGICQEGARSHGLLNLSKSDYFAMKIPYPSIETQNEVAEILNLAESEIELLRYMLEKYKEQKRGLMQKMLTGEWRVKDEIISKYKET